MTACCHIFRARDRIDPVGVAILSAILMLGLSLGTTQAEPVVEVVRGEMAQSAGPDWLENLPLHFTLGVETGYDDNRDLTETGSGSWFSSENFSLAYDRAGQRTQIHLLGSAGLTQYYDSTDTSSDDVTAQLGLSLTHIWSTRLSFAAEISASYSVEPDFKSNIGPQTVRSNHFATNDMFSATYHWLPRLSSITSYTISRIKYDDFSVGAFEDRVGQTFGEVLQFSRSTRTNVFAEYRFETVNYDTAPNDSTTHFLLGGLEHHLTEHLVITARGGETLRSSEGVDTTNPHFEGSLNYANGKYSSVNWTASYGVEEPTVRGASSSLTFRTGVQLTYALSARIQSTAAFYYNRSENQGSILPGPGPGPDLADTQDSFDFNLRLAYTINQRFAVHIDYTRSSVTSDQQIPGFTSDYSRNRYSAGLSFNY